MSGVKARRIGRSKYWLMPPTIEELTGPDFEGEIVSASTRIEGDEELVTLVVQGKRKPDKLVV